jgi:formylglycine-generating enzyme required for sulfatase activity
MPSSARGRHLQTQLDELRRRYAILTKRIEAADTDISRALDLVRKQILEEERAGFTAERERVSADIERLERELRGETHGATLTDSPVDPSSSLPTLPVDEGSTSDQDSRSPLPPAPVTPDDRRLPGETRGTDLLWGLAGAGLVGMLCVLFFQPFACLIEYRISEAVVGLIVFLAGGAAFVLTGLTPPHLRSRLRALVAGLASVLLLAVLLVIIVPAPRETNCGIGKSPTPTPPVRDMVWVPGGAFTMGSDNADSSALDNEKPQRSVSVEGFWISRTEVTNAQYLRCVEAEGHPCTVPGNDSYSKPESADLPVVDVTWEQANAYARWVGGRLPTEAEWEKACRGTDARNYPWGDELPTNELANYNRPKTGAVTKVGSYPLGESPYGLLDMAGNVWEWTSSQPGDYPYHKNGSRESPDAASRVLRGGAFYDIDVNVRCAVRIWNRTDQGYMGFGFRVAASPRDP